MGLEVNMYIALRGSEFMGASEILGLPYLLLEFRTRYTMECKELNRRVFLYHCVVLQQW